MRLRPNEFCETPPTEEGSAVGKLPLERLRSLLKHLPKHDPRLLIGPQIGEDAAVIDAGDCYLVVTTDPITFATDQIGRYPDTAHFKRDIRRAALMVIPKGY